MDKVSDILFLAAETIIYMVAVTTALTSYRGFEETYHLMKKNIGYENILYEQDYNISSTPDAIIYSHLQLKSFLFSGIDNDIKIDNMMISASSFQKYSFDYTLVEEYYYKKEYVYNDDGTIDMILFTRV